MYTTIQWNHGMIYVGKDLYKSFGPTVAQRRCIENRLPSEVFNSVLNTPRKRDTTVSLDKLLQDLATSW